MNDPKNIAQVIRDYWQVLLIVASVFGTYFSIDAQLKQLNKFQTATEGQLQLLELKGTSHDLAIQKLELQSQQTRDDIKELQSRP